MEYSVFRQNTYKDNGDRCLPTSYEGLKFNLQVGSFFECAGLASESWIWFGKCRNYCVDTSWPPESSMHPTRGAYWLSSLQKTVCPPATPSTGSIVFFYTGEIHSFAPLTVTLTICVPPSFTMCALLFGRGKK